MVGPEQRLSRVVCVVFLVEGRTREDAHHARTAQIHDCAADVVLAGARRDVECLARDGETEVPRGNVRLAGDALACKLKDA